MYCNPNIDTFPAFAFLINMFICAPLITPVAIYFKQ